MATASEIQSLEELSYKSRIKVFFYPFIISSLFIFAFLNFYPIGDQIKILMQKNLRGTGCSPDFDEMRIEWFLPKVVISDVKLPASCFGRMGEPVNLSFLKINFNFISFAPFGIPFRIDTDIYGQELSFYYVQGFGERMVRIKDQSILLPRLQPLFGDKVKMAGNLTVDLLAHIESNNTIKNLSIMAKSDDFIMPSQNIEGFTTPDLKVNTFFLEANSADSASRVVVEKFIIGDPDSPLRADFKGTVDLQQGNIAMSQLNLTGELGLSQSFKEAVPLAEMFFQRFTNKDGFYQIKLSGTVARPLMINP